ncbi:hypothetical protein OW763_04295 [Clostridium aestuarii]|uniref:Uncharacterized protein n=1 Tax=Clostridium aestuarii TaxID=338193 RepID=A0ABT4CX46_9CLOT|nr:hypothetical protein [Clostridium aestuarii]MCY6483572.1 hypothetical protein [Clostridium aestuarii]
MKNILMIAYYYPPKGGAGVQRTTKFANYLNKLGYNVNVLTVKEEAKGIVDKSLNKDISEGIDVYRSDIKEINLMSNMLNVLNKKNSNNNISAKDNNITTVDKNSLNTKMKKTIKNICKSMFFNVYNMMCIPDDKKGWIDFAVDEGRKIIKCKKIDFIFTTSGPYSSHIIGYKLAKEFPVKWIADFRDPWVNNPFVNNNFVVESIYKKLEKKVVQKADKVISVSQPIVNEFLIRYKNEDRDKFHVITNGYDEKDFKDLNLDLAYNNEKFSILYNGTLYGKRSPKKILESIDNLIETKKIDKNKIQIKFLGQIGNEHKGIVNYYKDKYPDIIKNQSYVPHEESLKELSRANSVLLIIDEGKGSEGIYTGKIFEYIRTGKPILGIVPDGVAKELIYDTNTGYTAYPSKQDEIQKMIHSAYRDFINKSNFIKPDFDKIKQYSRENLTKKLVDIIEQIK